MKSIEFEGEWNLFFVGEGKRNSCVLYMGVNIVNYLTTGQDLRMLKPFATNKIMSSIMIVFSFWFFTNKVSFGSDKKSKFHQSCDQSKLVQPGVLLNHCPTLQRWALGQVSPSCHPKA